VRNIACSSIKHLALSLCVRRVYIGLGLDGSELWFDVSGCLVLKDDGMESFLCTIM
jgi:hypothetical protein